MAYAFEGFGRSEPNGLFFIDDRFTPKIAAAKLSAKLRLWGFYYEEENTSFLAPPMTVATA